MLLMKKCINAEAYLEVYFFVYVHCSTIRIAVQRQLYNSQLTDSHVLTIIKVIVIYFILP